MTLLYYNGQAVGFDLWKPGFKASSSCIPPIPVWIRLPGLPIEYWGPKTLVMIASHAGFPIMMDEFTATRERGLFARICVKMDLQKPLSAGTWIHGSDGRFFQRFEYEGLSDLCFSCGLLGHPTSNCPTKPPPPLCSVHQPPTSPPLPCFPTPQSQPLAPSGEPLPNMTSILGPKPTPIDDQLGPWTLVPKRTRKSKPPTPHPSLYSIVNPPSHAIGSSRPQLVSKPPSRPSTLQIFEKSSSPHQPPPNPFSHHSPSPLKSDLFRKPINFKASSYNGKIPKSKREIESSTGVFSTGTTMMEVKRPLKGKAKASKGKNRLPLPTEDQMIEHDEKKRKRVHQPSDPPLWDTSSPFPGQEQACSHTDG
ncbi:Uncharacterized protein AXF42_Ash012950 [Apostasia shenzhenica]|uniref:CCHC-type domain-containing protein n=1 Tax=Apostasia shenzhenica TaxID=1088818 RepID=A0A2I0ARQ4_9ASPA|nr:Uncharacterized protein AXF42_Ash012950 [Apostasia shenzhenica]